METAEIPTAEREPERFFFVHRQKIRICTNAADHALAAPPPAAGGQRALLSVA
jgi:hypothetical protein